MFDSHLKMDAEKTAEWIETIMHRGTDVDRKKILKVFGEELARLSPEYFDYFLEQIMQYDDPLEEPTQLVGSEFEEGDPHGLDPRHRYG